MKLFRWTEELVRKEWWGRDGGMSTPDNRIWVYGDSPVFPNSKSPALNLKRTTWGSTWTKDGKERGQYGGIDGERNGERRWPTGITMFRGLPLVTFVRVFIMGTEWHITGYGWRYMGITHLRDERVAWGSPRVEKGKIVVIRVDPFINEPYTWQRHLTGGAETILPIPWSPNVSVQWGKISYAARMITGGWQCLQSHDRQTWTTVGAGECPDGSMTFWPHANARGVLMTWWDSNLRHLVEELISTE